MKLFAALTFLVVAVSAGASPQIQIESGSHEPVVRLNSRDRAMGIVSAGSTFHDLSIAGATVDTIGSATLVRLQKTGTLAVLTAAHVVGGKNPWTEVGGKHLVPKAIYIDNDRDIAILDLGKNKAQEALVLTPKGLSMAPAFSKSIDAGSIPIVVIAYYQPSHALAFALSPWVDPGVESAYTRSIIHAPIVSMSANDQMVRVYTKITSGASGSAVFDLREKSVAGLVVQSHYYFSETYLVAPDVLNAAFSKYSGGMRGSQSKTEWKMKNRLAYRAFEDGTEEANFGTNHVSGVIGQPGAGVIGQPGSGVIGQPGSGVIGQPTNGVIGQPTNGIIGQPGNGVIGQPSEKKEFLPWTEDPRAVFEFFKIEPGIIWKGQPILGFRVKSKVESVTWPSAFLLLGETEGVQFLKENASAFEIEPIKSNVNFVDLLKERLGVSPADKATLKLTTLYGPSAIVDDAELKRNAESASVEITAAGQIHVHALTYSKMNRQAWVLEPDEIDFTLNANGAPNGGNRFLPVIETKGTKSGESYYVDLRQFFFADYSQLARPMSDWSTENPPFEMKRFDLPMQIKTIGFSVRNAKSGAEFIYGFAH